LGYRGSSTRETETTGSFDRTSIEESQTEIQNYSHEKEDELEESHRDYTEDAQITDRQKKEMHERRERVVQHLKEEGLQIEDDHIFGSVMQGTMTGPLDQNSDVDVMIVLDADEHREWAEGENGPRNALEAVKRRLEKKYPNQEVTVDRNVVAVKFSDFTVEVAPAFRYSHVCDPEHPSDPVTLGGMEFPARPMDADDPEKDGYVIPDTYGETRWTGTNPRKFQSMYNAVNRNHNGDLQRVAVAAKKVNEQNGNHISSYHAVMMAYKYFENDAPPNASTQEHMNNFFRNLPRYLDEETREPVYQERLDKGLDEEERAKAIKMAYQKSRKIEEAERLQKEGKYEEAKEKYEEIYGNEFN